MNDTTKQQDTVHKLFTPTLTRIISKQAFVVNADSYHARRQGGQLALRGVAEAMADVLAGVDKDFDRVRFLRECGVR